MPAGVPSFYATFVPTQLIQPHQWVTDTFPEGMANPVKKADSLAQGAALRFSERKVKTDPNPIIDAALTRSLNC